MVEVVALTGLVRRLGRDAERSLTTDPGHGATSHDLLRRVRAWHEAFAVAPGRRYALHLEDSLEFVAALLGAWHADKIVYLPADILPSTLLTLAADVDGFAGTFADGLQRKSTLPPPDVAWDDLDPETIRLVLYTSGSAGDPVAIGKCLRQLDSEIATLESRFGALLGDAQVHGTVSHQHIYGLLFRVLWPLATQRRFATYRLAYPEQIAALPGSQPTALVASPALLKRLPESVDWSSTRSALRAVFSSGGPLHAEAGVAIDRLWGQKVIEVFGSTETGGIAIRVSGHGTWQPLPGVECKVDEAALLVRSRHLAENHWLRTEDRARMVGEGFELLGRSDRLIKLEERRISLDAIERALRADGLVDEARVVVLAGSRERVVAVIVPSAAGCALLSSAGRKILIDRLRDALHRQVDPIAVPKLWRFVAALPGDAQGKTTMKQLAELFRATQPVPEWNERSASDAKLQVAVTGDLAVFDGHFPGAHVLPGVALVDWAIAWGRDAFGIPTPFVRMDALKFQRLVRPNTQLQLELGWRAESATLHFSYRSTQGTHASGRIVFTDPDAPA